MKFEYKVIDAKNSEDHLNWLGEMGWELCVGIELQYGTRLYFKREKPSEVREKPSEVREKPSEVREIQPPQRIPESPTKP